VGKARPDASEPHFVRPATVLRPVTIGAVALVAVNALLGLVLGG
jgi:hypothetical protein